MSDIRYIIKRVIIGVLISIILMIISSLKVKALSFNDFYNITSFVNQDYRYSENFNVFNRQSGVGYNFWYHSSNLNLTINTNDYNAFLVNPNLVYSTTDYQQTFQITTANNGYIYVPNANISFQVKVYYDGSTGRINCSYDNGLVACPLISDSGSLTINTFTIELLSYCNSVGTSLCVSDLSGYYIFPSTYMLAKSYNSILEDTSNSVNDINNNITSEEAPSTDDVGNNSNEWASNNANNGVINQLVQLPITLLNSVVNGLSSSCSPYNFGNLFGTDLIFPCVNMQDILGVVLWTTIDLIISGIFVFKFGSKLVQIFNNFTNLKGGQVDQLYGGVN